MKECAEKEINNSYLAFKKFYDNSKKAEENKNRYFSSYMDPEFRRFARKAWKRTDESWSCASKESNRWICEIKSERNKIRYQHSGTW